jgi:hypothetical protein
MKKDPWLPNCSRSDDHCQLIIQPGCVVVAGLGWFLAKREVGFFSTPRKFPEIAEPGNLAAHDHELLKHFSRNNIEKHASPFHLAI